MHIETVDTVKTRLNNFNQFSRGRRLIWNIFFNGASFQLVMSTVKLQFKSRNLYIAMKYRSYNICSSIVYTIIALPSYIQYLLFYRIYNICSSIVSTIFALLSNLQHLFLYLILMFFSISVGY